MKQITRRELFKEITSKDTLKQVIGAWYGFRKPFLSEEQATNIKKSSLFETIKKVDMKFTKNNGKEG